MSVISGNAFESVAASYTIANSIRLRSSNSAYLSRTVATTGSRTNFTVSMWVKRGTLGATQRLAEAAGASNVYSWFGFSASDELQFVDAYGGTTYINYYTSGSFRDPSAWYHIVIAVNGSAGAGQKVKFYVNGVDQARVMASDSTDATRFNLAGETFNLFRDPGVGGSPAYYFDGYAAEINWVDGQTLDASYFGQIDSATGQWVPKKYSGTYGTNGFWLGFKNGSNVSALGTDTAYAEGLKAENNFLTVSSLSLTAGPTYDWMLDTPTSNYCVLNPLTVTAGNWSNGNLHFLGPTAWERPNGTLAVTSGKWYWEVVLSAGPFTPRASNTQYHAFGFGLSTAFNSTVSPISITDAVVLMDSGYYKNFGGAATDGGTTFVNGDILSCAIDQSANTFTFYRNGTQVVTGTIGVSAGTELIPVLCSYDGSYGVMESNFGQQPWDTRTATIRSTLFGAGYKALTLANVADSVIKNGKLHFDAVSRAGTSNTASITSLAFEPGMLWGKSRTTADYHIVQDICRGFSSLKKLATNLTNAEGNPNDIAGYYSAVLSNGFTVDKVGTDGVNDWLGLNKSGSNYVDFAWKAGGAPVTNNSGSITSQVSANTVAGFSIVTYTGTGANATVGHGLGVAPKMVIAKSRSTGAWVVWHVGLSGGTYYLLLNSADAQASDPTIWPSAPTSTVFSVGSQILANGYVAYCFAEVSGFSKFGSYTGNGSTNGTFVYCGFKPRWVMIKNTGWDNTQSWVIHDTARATYNVDNVTIMPNSANQESTTLGADIDILANGFKLRNGNTLTNASGNTYVFIAFAEAPFKYSTAR